MTNLRLLGAPFLCVLIWTFCVPHARAHEPGAGTHQGSVGLDKNTVHDQEYVFTGCWGSPTGLPTFFPLVPIYRALGHFSRMEVLCPSFWSPNEFTEPDFGYKLHEGF